MKIVENSLIIIIVQHLPRCGDLHLAIFKVQVFAKSEYVISSAGVLIEAHNDRIYNGQNFGHSLSSDASVTATANGDKEYFFCFILI